MKEIYVIYQCSREDFIKAAKKGVKLSSMPFNVNAFVVYSVKSKKDALKDCVKWNFENGKQFMTINWFAKISLY